MPLAAPACTQMLLVSTVHVYCTAAGILWPAGISCRDRDGIHAFPSAPSKIVIRGFSGSGSALSYVIRGFSGSGSALSLSKDNSIVLSCTRFTLTPFNSRLAKKQKKKKTNVCADDARHPSIWSLYT